MTRKLRKTLGVFAIFLMAPYGAAMAETGLYIGGGIGSAGVDLDFQDIGINLPNFDEDDFGWKIMAGYNVDLPVFDLGVELGYVDFGQPSGDILGADVEFDSTGFDVFGVAGFDVGPIVVFGKLGYVTWDLEATVSAIGVPSQTVSDDGSDMAYGAGLRFGLGPLEVRGEYEVFDIEDTDINMVSASLNFYFD